MALLKQIKFGTGAATPIAQTQVAIDQQSSTVLTAVGTNTGLDVEQNPVYTIALAVDGKTITKTGNDGLATALQLKYHAAVTEGTPKGAYIALEDNTGASISGSEIPVADIIGNGVLKSASYSETTGILTLTFATASGTDTTVNIDLGKLFDIDDIIINSTDGSANYLSFDLANPAAETGQAVLSVKLADVTFTAASGSTAANLTVNTTNGNMLAADDAIPAIKQYVDAQTTDLAVTAQGDNYITAAQDASNNKKINVTADVQALTATAGTPGVYGTDGSQTTPSVEGTLSGTANSLADGADIATKVKTYVDGAIAIEAARSDAKNKADIAALDVTDTAVTGQYVSQVSETDGKVSISRANVSDAVLTGYAKGKKPASTAIAATDDVKGAIAKLEHQVDDAEAAAIAAINALDFTDTPVDSQYVTKVDETNGVVSVERADVSGAKLNNYQKGKAELPLAATDTINQAFSKIEVSIEKNENVTSTALNEINTKINGMDKAANAVAGQVVTTVSEADGVVSETKANVKDLQLGGYSKGADKGAIASTDTINVALSKLENSVGAIQYKVDGTTLVFYGISEKTNA